MTGHRRTGMHRLLLTVLALVLVLPACGDDDGTNADDETPDTAETEELPELVVVFGPDEEETSIHGEEVTWTPDADDVLAVEEVLAEHLEAEAADRGVEPLETYARQYVGIGEDEALVSVNALCETGDLDWEDELILVNDGGPCFWQATVDPSTGTVESFTVNGVA